jgi:hypothetical protein
LGVWNEGGDITVYEMFCFPEKDEDQSLTEFMEALQDTKEVDPENNRLSMPQTKEERITMG